MTIETVKRMHVEPGDLVFIRCQDDATRGQMHVFGEILSEFFGDCGAQFIIFNRDIDFQKLKDDELERVGLQRIPK